MRRKRTRAKRACLFLVSTIRDATKGATNDDGAGRAVVVRTGAIIAIGTGESGRETEIGTGIEIEIGTVIGTVTVTVIVTGTETAIATGTETVIGEITTGIEIEIAEIATVTVTVTATQIETETEIGESEVRRDAGRDGIAAAAGDEAEALEPDGRCWWFAAELLDTLVDAMAYKYIERIIFSHLHLRKVHNSDCLPQWQPLMY